MTITVPRRAFIALVAVLSIGAAAAAGFFIGQGSVDTGHYRHIGFNTGYDAGITRGRADGQRETRALYQPGEPDYEAIYTKGRKAGFHSGRAEGLGAGRSEGITTGENGAFEGFSGWDVGAWYIVRIGQGTDGAKFSLSRRVEMDSDHEYTVCPQDPVHICNRLTLDAGE